MGKGNRSRQDRALETVQNTQEATPKSTKVKTAIATAAVAFLIVGCILLSVIVNTGLVLRMKTAANTDNYEVSGTVMTYLVYSQAQYYYSMYQSYGLTNYTLADIIDTMGIKSSVLDQAKQMLVLCEYAKAHNLTLSADDEADIDAYIESIEQEAANNLYSTNAYVKLMYGNGVNIKDIREALELSYLSNVAYEALEKELEGKITDELVNKYVEENVASFYFADYLTYTFTANLDAAGAKATEEEQKAYEDAKAEMAALAEELQKVDSVDAFNDFVINYIVNTLMSENFDQMFEDSYKATLESEGLIPEESVFAADKAEVLAKVTDHLNDIYTSTVSETEETEEEEEEETLPEDANDYVKALDTLLDKLIDKAETAYEDVINLDYAHYTPAEEGAEDTTSEFDKWLFDAETKVGDTKLISNADDEEATKTTYSVSILMTASALKDEIATYDVGHILVKFDVEDDEEPTEEQKAAAKAEAEAILEQYLAGEKTLDAFKALGEEKTDDSNVVYENTTLGQMVEPFENWAIDEARKEGDVEIVETEYGYHVMYFIDNALTSESGVLSELFNEWLEAEAVNCHYSYNQSVIDSIQ